MRNASAADIASERGVQNGQPVCGEAAGPAAPQRDPFAFLGDARLVGLWTLFGLVPTVIQTFFH
ncbi:hypothetical protein [Nocardia sp. CY41]|uniref:hypothetical protein n=1 Tax=Nocardia sp. CY41 TaxID=2608686 RepID=UPI0013590727|nr:hypothetical protein [Nocardia sp. CY41]